MSKKYSIRAKFSPLTITMLILLSIYVFVLLFLLLWGVMQVFKPWYEMNKNPIWFPSSETFTLANFKAIVAYTEMSWMPATASVRTVPLLEVFANSILYALGGALVNVTVMCVTAYFVAKYNYWYSKLMLSIAITVMAIPIVGSQMSEIAVLDFLGLYNTRYGFLVLKASFLGIYFLMFYEVFKGMPKTYNEAAAIDGAGDVRIMVQICFPLAINVYTTVLLITFIQFWNDYQVPLLYMPNYPTLSYFLFKVQISSQSIKVPGEQISVSTSSVPFKMASTFMLMTPILILFIAFNKKLMGNLSIGGIKG